MFQGQIIFNKQQINSDKILTMCKYYFDSSRGDEISDSVLTSDGKTKKLKFTQANAPNHIFVCPRAFVVL